MSVCCLNDMAGAYVEEWQCRIFILCGFDTYDLRQRKFYRPEIRML
jgi:hypothetical protein